MSFLMQPNKFENIDTDKDYYICRNFNSVRILWDGGIKGIEVSWNVGELTTGLWDENGKIIHAPKSWLEKLPNVPLDGIIYFINTDLDINKITQKKRPTSSEWENIKFVSMDSPGLDDIFQEKEFIDKISINKLKDFALSNNIKWEKSKNFKIDKKIITANYIPWDHDLSKNIGSLLKINKYGYFFRLNDSTYETGNSDNFLFSKEEI